MSESFSNNSTVSRGTFATNGAPAANLTGTTTTVTVSYAQANQSYTITTQGRSQTFAAADKDTSQSSAQITTYKKVNGGTTDLLTLTNPGTSGSLLYKYVAGGFWQRTVQSGTSLTGSFDSFAYGVASPNAAVPTTGGASYDLDFLGVLGSTTWPTPFGLGGTGVMTIDFGAGLYTTSGTVSETDLQTGSVLSNDTFSGQGTLAAGSNSLAGSFQLNRGGGGGQVFAGNLSGRFYGPAADEVGAAVFANTQGGSAGALSGVLVGRKGTSGSGTNLSLLSLVANQNFVTQGARVASISNPGSGTTTAYSQQDVSQFGGSGSVGPSFSYSAATNSYTIFGSVPAPGQMGPASGTYGAAQIAASQPDARFVEYRTSNGADGTQLWLYKAGAGNPELALTYASFGIWDQTQTPGSNGLDSLERTYFTYGIASTGAPRTGTANFAGIIIGHGGATAGGGDPLSVAGDFNFTFDFAADSFSGSFSPMATNLRTNATTALGTYSPVNTRGPMAAAGGFDGYLSLAGAAQSSGALKGSFFGPVYNEIAGTFVIREVDPANAGNFIGYTGAFIGKKN